MSPIALPIDPVLPELVSAIEARGAAVLVAPPGAGKTTRVPPALLDAGLAECDGQPGKIILLEPRRVAARAAARRIASERGANLGEEVGYRIRFEKKESRTTRITVVTEGVLVALLQRDPFLEGVAALVFDEFHERNLESDLALAMARRLREEARPDLRIIAMSATLDPYPLARFLGAADEPAPIVESPGRLHPVTTVHVPPPSGPRLPRIEDTVTEAVRQTLDGTHGETPGDLLVFLPGVGEILASVEKLAPLAESRGLDLFPLYGDLPPEEQDRALRGDGRRRIVLATNVAESSVTVEGVTAVIDSGLARVPRLDLSVGLDRLELGSISRASADQRTGRAGRVAPGLCVRLWSAIEERGMPATESPEITRVDLSGPVLQLLAWGETDLTAFPWFESPDAPALERALALLEQLGAVRDGRITSIGEKLARFALPPRLGRLALAVEEVGHADRLAMVAALLSERDPMRGGRRRPDDPPVTPTDSDVLERVRRLEQWQKTKRLSGDLHRGAAHRIRQATKQIRGQLERHAAIPKKSSFNADEAVARALLVAYPDRVARRRAEGDRRGVLVGGRGVHLRPESGVVDPELFLCIDLDAGRRGERAEAGVRLASPVDRSWLDPALLREEELREFDAERRQVVTVRRTAFFDLAIEETRALAPPDEETAERLAEAAAENLEAALPLDQEALVKFRARIGWLREHREDLDFPALDDDAMRSLLPALCAGKRSFADLKKALLLDFVRGLLTPEQSAALEREAPERIEVPSGRTHKIEYTPGKAPILAVRIQEVFGWTETPRLAGGRVPLLLHLLAPNHRPQQVTDDLKSFWENTYSVVRKELRRRYPKHAWPEDPWTAQAERRPQRRR